MIKICIFYLVFGSHDGQQQPGQIIHFHDLWPLTKYSLDSEPTNCQLSVAMVKHASNSIEFLRLLDWIGLSGG